MINVLNQGPEKRDLYGFVRSSIKIKSALVLCNFLEMSESGDG